MPTMRHCASPWKDEGDREMRKLNIVLVISHLLFDFPLFYMYAYPSF